jgi:acetylglutamate kinase
VASLHQPKVLLSATERAAAVIVQGQDGLPYLEKFAVTPDAQGEGLGAAMWQVLRARYPQLYWRSRNTNPITGWYFQQADSSERLGPWVVFTNGINDVSQRARVVAEAMQRDPGWQESGK